MTKIIKGNQQGLKGGNNTYTIPGRGSDIPRQTLVKEVNQGNDPKYITTKINGKEYIKAKPNKKINVNVNKDI